MKNNKGIFWQLRHKKIIYPKHSSGITRRHVKLAYMYIWGLNGIYGTYDNPDLNGEEELDIALEHWEFLYKYNLIVNLKR